MYVKNLQCINVKIYESLGKLVNGDGKPIFIVYSEQSAYFYRGTAKLFKLVNVFSLSLKKKTTF